MMRIDGRAARADEAPGSALQQVRDDAHPAVRGDDDIEGPTFQRGRQRLGEMRVRVDVLHWPHEFDFVLASVKHGDLEAALQQAVNGVRTGWTGAADHECFHRVCPWADMNR